MNSEREIKRILKIAEEYGLRESAAAVRKYFGWPDSNFYLLGASVVDAAQQRGNAMKAREIAARVWGSDRETILFLKRRIKALDAMSDATFGDYDVVGFAGEDLPDLRDVAVRLRCRKCGHSILKPWFFCESEHDIKCPRCGRI